MPTLNAMMLKTVQTIAEGSAIEGWCYANAKSPPIRALQKDGFIEGNLQMIDPTNPDRIAFKLTAKGHAEVGTPETPAAGAPATPAAPAAPPPAATGLTPPPPGVDIQKVAAGTRGRKVGSTAIPPAITRFSARMAAIPVAADGRASQGVKESYPFATLAAPDATGVDYFFVANTAVMPNAFKTVKAAVSSANRRYEKKTPAAHFTVRTHSNEGVDGCAVYRDK